MDRSELKRLLAEAERLKLKGWELLRDTPDEIVLKVCNGIGPSWFPAALRKSIDALHPSLKSVAAIHDLRYWLGDGTDADFNDANDDFAYNGKTVADDRYGWWNPARYIARHNAAKFAWLCKEGGKVAYHIAIGERKALEECGL